MSLSISLETRSNLVSCSVHVMYGNDSWTNEAKLGKCGDYKIKTSLHHDLVCDL